MSLTKRKFIGSFVDFSLNSLILAAFLANILNPAVANADFGSKFSFWANDSQEVVLSESREGRLFSPNVDLPDKKLTAVITAYTSTVDQCDDDPFIAASGKHVYDGMIAANFLPLGTKIKIPALYGDKVFTVDDRMNARYGYGRMDIWLDTTKAEARKFGVKRVEVEIYYIHKNTQLASAR